MKLKIFLLFSLLIFAACAPKTEADVDAKPKETVPTAELISQSDALFAKRTDLEKLREAVKTISRARNPDKRDFEVEWRVAKFNYFLSRQLS